MGRRRRPVELINGNCKIVLEHIGEGRSGDWDPDDPDDEPLMRFDVYHRSVGGEWEDPGDASYCTQINDNVLDEVKRRALEHLMSEIGPEINAGNRVKRLCERLSWISADDFKEEVSKCNTQNS
jgi:hypothetical protein